MKDVITISMRLVELENFNYTTQLAISLIFLIFFYQADYISYGISYARRGCVRNLKEHMRPVCLGQSDICKTCIGNDCNSMIEFRSCYATNGEELPSSQPGKKKICKHFDDKCFSFVNENGYIIKGCLSEFTENKNVPIDHFAKNHNASVYRECSSSLCNDEDIKPLWCVGCDSRLNETCFGTAYTKRVRCPLELTSSGCYHHDVGKHVTRGCIAHLDKKQRELCESDSDECKKCVETNCNWKPMFQKCMTTNPNNLAHTQSKVCKRYTDQCFTHVSDETVRRGCISDITEATDVGIGINIKDCDNEAICETCKGTNDCNNQVIKHEQCIVCTSATNNICSYYMKGLEAQCPLSPKPLGCYLKIDENFKVERGCMNELVPSRRKYCREKNDICKYCIGDNCNQRRNFQKCWTCDSEVDGKYCIQSPWMLKDKKMCPNYLDDCYTYVMNGRVIRNCTGDATIPSVESCDILGRNCKHCDDMHGCNEESIKTETCVACNSTIDPSCATNATFDTFETCPFSLNANICYHIINATTGEHTRGKLKIFT